MINSIQLENFKAFGKRVRIPLAPITLIFGENSSGKSSILHSLNLLKQTRESREPGALLLPRSEQGISDLGSFQDILFDHDLRRPLSIQLEISIHEGSQPSAYLSRTLSRMNLNGVGIELTFRRPSLNEEVFLEEVRIIAPETQEYLAGFQPIKEVPPDVRRDISMRFRRDRRLLRATTPNLGIAKCTYITRNPKYWTIFYNNAKRTKDRLMTGLNLWEKSLQSELQSSSDPEEHQSALFEDDVRSSTDKQDTLKALEEAKQFYTSDFELNTYIERIAGQQIGTMIGLDGFLPLGASRSQYPSPEEMAFRYIRPGYPLNETMLDVSNLALFAGRLLEQTLEDVFPLGPFRRPPERWYIFTGTSPQDVGYKGEQLPDLLFRSPDLVDEANQWLKELNIGYKLKINSLGATRKDLFEVQLEDIRRNQSVTVGLSDVGFGISQILPLLVQSLASEGKIISIEQPEVHIHPKLQADLGDLLARAIEEPRNNQFIIETHSEHLVLRLQRLVREGRLKPADLSIIYVSRDPDGAAVQNLRIDEEGDFIDDWPGGFFPERLRELR